MTSGDGLKYEPGIDGLRAVAVVVVLLFHGGFAWMSGGFLGVSVFFTLSGFLITRLLLDEHRRTGSIALMQFWGRRLRRLAPASLVCLFGVVVLSPWWSDVLQREALRVDVWAAVTYWPNWRFIAADQSYAELFAAPSPVLHFWSLAIEEQFYFVYPVITAIVLRLGRARPRLALGAALTGLLVASSVATQFTSDRDLLYYGTHIRAAELLIGGLLAVASPRLTTTVAGAARWGGPAAIAAIVALSSWSSITSQWLYDGRLVLFAALSAVTVVSATVAGPLRVGLSWRPLVVIGRVSYGLYLFHWPIFLLLNERRVGWSRGPLFALRVAVTAVVTLLSYALIEQPVRRRMVLVVPRVARLALGGAVAVVAVVAPLTRPGANAPTAAAEIPTGVVTFVPPVRSSEPAAPSTVVVPTVVVPTTVVTTTSAPTPATGTTPPRPAAVIVGFAGADLSVRARLMGIDGVDLRDLLPVGCPLVSEASESGCPAAHAAMPRMTSAIRPALTVLAFDSTDRALVDQALPADRLLISERLTHDVRRSVEGALTETSTTLLIDTSGLTDAVSLGIEQAILAHPAVDRVESPDLRPTVSRLVAELTAPVVALEAEPTSTTASTVASSPSRAQKVLVIGDSTSYEFAAALARVGEGLEVIWGGGANCPVVDVDALRWQDGAQWPMDECPNVTSGWPETIAETKPDVVLIVAGLAEQSLHRYPGATVWSQAGDAAFGAAHDQMMSGLLELIAPLGGVVAVADAPPIINGSFAASEMAQADRLTGWNTQIASWDAQWQPVFTLPYAAAVARVEATNSQREDGVHLNQRAADLVATELAPMLLDRLAVLRPALVASTCLDPAGTLRMSHCAETDAVSGD